MKSYQHHIGDFDKSTRHLNRIERSVYRDLMDLYYSTESCIPLDMEAVCRKIVARSNEESTAVQQVLNEFFTETATGWFHDRCDAEIDKFRANNSQKAQAGKASAAKREEKRQQALSARSTDVETPYNGTSTNQKPETRNQKPIKPLSATADGMGDVTHVFGHWQWRMNHKNAKLDDKRKKLIQKALKLGYTTTDLIAAIDGCAKSPHHMGQNDTNTVYDDLGLILRDAGKIDGFIKRNNLPTQAGSANAAHKPALTGTAARNSAVSQAIRNLCTREAGAGDAVSAGDIPDIADGDAGEVLEHVPD